MKIRWTAAFLLLTSFAIHGQGFVYDQQSSTNENAAFGGPVMQDYSLVQSFTPSFSAINFVKLAFYDSNVSNNLGATVFLTLRSNAYNGPVISSTAPVFMPDGFGRSGLSAGVTNFFFPTTIGLNPGEVYYFELVLQSGDSWHTSVSEYNTPGAHLFFDGQQSGMSDLWFREGIISTPEPPSLALLLLGGSSLACLIKRKRQP